MRREIEEFDKKIEELIATCEDDATWEAALEELHRDPLWEEWWQEVGAERDERWSREIFKRFLEGLEGTAKTNFPLQLVTLIEELSPIFGTKAAENVTWQVAKKMEVAYRRIAEKKRLLRSAKRGVVEAEEEYDSATEEMGLHLLWRGLAPFGGDIDDPMRWFLTIEEVIDAVRQRIGWELTVSKIRSYQKMGLIEKAIRVGEKGRALYSPITPMHLYMIKTAKDEGYSLSQIKEEMPSWLKGVVQMESEKPYFGGWWPYAQLVGSQAESEVRENLLHLTEENLKVTSEIARMIRGGKEAKRGKT